MRFLLNAADRLSLSFIALLCGITLVFVPVHSWGPLLGTQFALAAALLALASYRDRAPAGETFFYLHLAFTVAMVLILFNSMGALISGARPGISFDDWLIKTDYLIFGAHPTVWTERLINPFLTAVLQLAYISYYFMPISLGITLIAKQRRAEFEKALFGIVLCFYLSYIGYLLVPAIGPRFTLNGIQTTGLEAGPFITWIQETLNSLEHNKTDAFPSGHTAIALVTLYYSLTFREKMLSAVLLPAAFALIVSTVYLRYHYVVDVIAGIALAGATIALAPKLDHWLSGAAAQSENEGHRSPGHDRND